MRKHLNDVRAATESNASRAKATYDLFKGEGMNTVTGNILTVGQDQQFSTIAAAVADAQNGDTIQVMAGTYTNDFANINANITLEGVGGTVNMVCTEDIPNGKGIFVTNGDITITNFTFSGARVEDQNGAGIRYESGNLILNNDYFHDNEMGLLGGFDPSGSITVTNCEFANNSVRDPNSDHIGHNLYAGDVVGTLTIDRSYFHDAQIGHEIKSRALNTIITNSRIQDGPTGTASYSIDLPNGGNALIQNNVIEKGPLSENSTIITIGEEGSLYDSTNIQITGNQIISDLSSSSVVAVRNSTDAIADITGNQFYGLTEGQFVEGPSTSSDNQFFASDPTLLGAAPQAFDTTILDSLGGAGGNVITANPSDMVMNNWTGSSVEISANFAPAAADQSNATAGFTMFGAGSFGTQDSSSGSADLISSDPLTHFTHDPPLFFKNY